MSSLFSSAQQSRVAEDRGALFSVCNNISERYHVIMAGKHFFNLTAVGQFGAVG